MSFFLAVAQKKKQQGLFAIKYLSGEKKWIY